MMTINPETTRIQRYRSRWTRVDSYLGPKAMAAIKKYRDRNPKYSVTGIANTLILAGDRAVSGNANNGVKP